LELAGEHLEIDSPSAVVLVKWYIDLEKDCSFDMALRAFHLNEETNNPVDPYKASNDLWTLENEKLINLTALYAQYLAEKRLIGRYF